MEFKYFIMNLEFLIAENGEIINQQALQIQDRDSEITNLKKEIERLRRRM